MRPPQVTLAGWLVMAGSVVVVLMALGQGAVLHSLDTREAVEEYLSSPPGDQLGLDVQGMLTLLRVVWMVTAVARRRGRGPRLVRAAPLQGRPARAVRARGAALRHQLLLRRAARCQCRPGDGHRGDRDAVVPAGPGLVRRHRARGAGAAAPAAPAAAARADRPGPAARPPAAERAAAAPHAVRRPAAAATPRPRGDPRRSRGPACWRGCSTAAVFGLLGLVLVVMLASPDALIDAAHRENPDLADQGITDADLKAQHLRRSARVVMAWSAAAAALAAPRLAPGPRGRPRGSPSRPGWPARSACSASSARSS